MKRIWVKYLIFLGIPIAIYILAIYYAPPKVNWTESFSRHDANPFGTEILFQQIEHLFEDPEIMEVETDLNENFGGPASLYFDYLISDQSFLYVLINDQLPLDSYEGSELLNLVESGHFAFIAARDFGSYLSDTLKLETEYPLGAKQDTFEATFTSPYIPVQADFEFFKTQAHTYFTSFDTAKTTVLAYNQQKEANLIYIQQGAGAFILCSSPRLFCNYNMLHKENHAFVSTALSYVPKDASILWDEYYKRDKLEALAQRSNMQFINRNPALYWAFWLAVAAALLYVFFESKRKQREIPIQSPVPNSTLEFTETVGRLYFQSKNHLTIARKRVRVLLAYIRTHYFIQTELLDDPFLQTLAGKTGIDFVDLRQLFRMIDRVEKQGIMTQNELVDLNYMIEAFYKHTTNSKPTNGT